MALGDECRIPARSRTTISILLLALVFMLTMTSVHGSLKRFRRTEDRDYYRGGGRNRGEDYGRPGRRPTDETINSQDKLFVGNLPYTATEDELGELFSKFYVKSVHIVHDRETGRSKGFAFIGLESESDMQPAIEERNDTISREMVEVINLEWTDDKGSSKSQSGRLILSNILTIIGYAKLSFNTFHSGEVTINSSLLSKAKEI